MSRHRLVSMFLSLALGNALLAGCGDSHALGCSICVDITLDAMRLLRDGRTVPEIKAYVDATYARYGPSNMP